MGTNTQASSVELFEGYLGDLPLQIAPVSKVDLLLCGLSLLPPASLRYLSCHWNNLIGHRKERTMVIDSDGGRLVAAVLDQDGSPLRSMFREGESGLAFSSWVSQWPNFRSLRVAVTGPWISISQVDSPTDIGWADYSLFPFGGTLLTQEWQRSSPGVFCGFDPRNKSHNGDVIRVYCH